MESPRRSVASADGLSSLRRSVALDRMSSSLTAALSAMPAGPPHLGTRDALVKENRSLFRQNEGLQAELSNSKAACEALTHARDSETAAWTEEKEGLVELLNQLNTELSTLRKESAEEEFRLRRTLAASQSELHACSTRLERTHEALGITADKARRLEATQGRVQIDLDGTLSTLEDATRRHQADQAEAQEAFERREAQLMRTLQQREEQITMLATELNATRRSEQQYKESLARSTVAHETDALRLRHDIERLEERLEAAEARTLDPRNVSNAAFAGRAANARVPGRGPTRTYAHNASLKGVLESMVPPVVLASPAPRV